MRLASQLLFPLRVFCHWNGDGSELGVVIIKGTFAMGAGERGGYLAQQPEILLSDIFHGEPNVTSLRQEAELAPWQPKTDVTFNAVARSPEGKELEGWPVRVMVGDRASLAFQVCGERFWEPSGHVSKSWKLSPPGKLTELPLRYEYAYGGQVEDADGNVHVHEFNPVGRGFLGPLRSGAEARPAPQIGLPAEFAAASSDEPWMVCGLGPIGKAWLLRRALAGTFDDAWLRERHPRMPADYDFTYWNGAPLPLQIGPYLEGGEIITATGLRHDPRPYEIALPGVTPLATVHRHDGRKGGPYVLPLQSVHCDIADADPEKHWMSLVWRLALTDPDEIAEIEITAQNMPPVHRPAPKQPIAYQENKSLSLTERRDKAWAAAGVSMVEEERYAEEVRRKMRRDGEEQELLSRRMTERGWSRSLVERVRMLKEGEPVSGWAEGAALRLRDPDLHCSLVVPADRDDPRVLHIGGPDYVYRRPDQKDEWPPEMARPEPMYPWRKELPSERPVPVYVRLLEETIDVWRPVMARQLQGDVYQIMPLAQLPKGERWEFPIMAQVHCEPRVYTGGIFLTAIRLQEQDRHGDYR